jgi:hypothetical protein
LNNALVAQEDFDENGEEEVIQDGKVSNYVTTFQLISALRHLSYLILCLHPDLCHLLTFLRIPTKIQMTAGVYRHN